MSSTESAGSSSGENYDSDQPSIAQAVAALREAQNEAKSNAKRTKSMIDTTRAVADSGVLKTSRFNRRSSAAG